MRLLCVVSPCPCVVMSLACLSTVLEGFLITVFLVMRENKIFRASLNSLQGGAAVCHEGVQEVYMQGGAHSW